MAVKVWVDLCLKVWLVSSGFGSFCVVEGGMF